MFSELSWAGGTTSYEWGRNTSPSRVFLSTDRAVHGEKCSQCCVCVLGREVTLLYMRSHKDTHNSSTFVCHFMLVFMPKLLLCPVH